MQIVDEIFHSSNKARNTSGNFAILSDRMKAGSGLFIGCYIGNHQRKQNSICMFCYFLFSHLINKITIYLPKMDSVKKKWKGQIIAN